MAIAELSVPDPNVAKQAAQAVAVLSDVLQSSPPSSTRLRVSVDGPSGETQITVPVQAFMIFVEVLQELAKGNAVTVAPVHAELTTQQAADLLNVSRPYLIKLLGEGKIPHRRVGNRRKVRLVDLLDYKRRDEARGQKLLSELTAEAQEMGLDY